MTESPHAIPGASIAFDWWRRLNPENTHQTGAHRAALARLRRASTPTEAMLEPDALRLIERLPHHPDRVAVLAAILAHVRETVDTPVARAIGRSSLDDEQSATMSEVRFRRLLQARGDIELLDAMRRLVRLAKGRVHVFSLSDAILYWGDRTRKQWIFDYYGVASGAPADGPAHRPDPARNAQ